MHHGSQCIHKLWLQIILPSTFQTHSCNTFSVIEVQPAFCHHPKRYRFMTAQNFLIAHGWSRNMNYTAQCKIQFNMYKANQIYIYIYAMVNKNSRNCAEIIWNTLYTCEDPSNQCEHLFWIYRAIIIPHNGTFSDNGQKPPISDKIQLMWSKKKSILNTHPISVHAMFELDYMNTFQIMVRNHNFWSFCGH